MLFIGMIIMLNEHSHNNCGKNAGTDFQTGGELIYIFQSGQNKADINMHAAFVLGIIGAV